jgi:hypothetical protein
MLAMKIFELIGWVKLGFIPMLAIVGMLTSQALASESAAPTAAAAPSAQNATTLKVLTWNVYGAVRGGPLAGISPDCGGKGEPHCAGPEIDTDGFRFLDVLAERIADQKPQLVGLQELCGSQALGLERRLAERGYPMKVFFNKGLDDESRCPGPEVGSGGLDHPVPEGLEEATRLGSFGKAVAVPADAVATSEFQGPVVDTCLRLQSTAEIQFCSIHTSPEKIGSVASVLNNVFADDGPVIAVGDFNAQPHEEVMDPIYHAGPADDYTGSGSFYEAGQPCADPRISNNNCLGEEGRSRLTAEATTVFGGKIDHIFADHVHFDHTRAKSWVETPSSGFRLCSDHDMVWAEVVLGGGDFAAIAGKWKDVSHAGGSGVATLTIGSNGLVQIYDISCGCSTEPAQLQNLGMDPDWCQRGEPNCSSPAIGPAYSATVQWPAGSGMPAAPLMLRIQPYADAAGETVLAVNADWYINHAFTRTGANPE